MGTGVEYLPATATTAGNVEEQADKQQQGRGAQQAQGTSKALSSFSNTSKPKAPTAERQPSKGRGVTSSLPPDHPTALSLACFATPTLTLASNLIPGLKPHPNPP